MSDKPDSVMKHEKFEDLMKRYHGQMDSALYAAECACSSTNDARDSDCTGCPWRNERFYLPLPESSGTSPCKLISIRAIIGDHFEQSDIQIPEDNTQAEKKRER
jgi:hypothetical protein